MDKQVNRRDFLRVLQASLAASVLPGVSALAKNAKKPNFILIFADDLGYGDISGFGTKKSPWSTPCLQRMAAEGAKLTSFYVPMPYCAPSRAAILTGRYPFRSSMVYNPCPDMGASDFGLPQSEITIAEALKKHGYATSCIGKWHLGHIPKFLPRTQGFDEYFGILYSNDMRPVQLVENEEVVEYPVVQATLTKRYTDRALDFIERNAKKDNPFFIYLPHAMPHKPLAASEEFYTPETPDDLYGDAIRELDFSIGQVLDKLKQLGLDDNTMVIFTSDNGPWFGGSSGGLRGMKMKTWEGGIRVPMLAHWPGKIPAGLVNKAPIGSIDIFPTILAAAGVPIPDDRVIDGKDIWPVLTSPTAQSPHEALFTMYRADLAAVRSGKWKLHVRAPIMGFQGSAVNWIDPRRPDGITIIAPYEQPTAYPGLIGGDGPKTMMLFDIESDPAEQHDLSRQHPDVVKRLQKLYDNMAAQIPALPPFKRTKLKRITGGKLKYD